MIGVKKAGRLGNQMFGYAFIFARAKQAKVPFFILPPRGMRRLQRYFILPSYSPFLNFIRALFFYPFFFFYLPFRREKQDRSFFMQGWDKPKRRVIYKGYFQSETFFLPYVQEIRREFSIKPKYRFFLPYHLWTQHKEWVDLRKKRIIMHVRRKDYATFISNTPLGEERDVILPLSYYQRALETIHHKEEYEIFIVTDDWAAVREDFTFLSYIPLDTGSSITDFQAMMQADILIISNSSFAWWAAYLNLHAEQILAPKNWFGFRKNTEYPIHMLCDHWQAVPVL